MKLKKHKRPQKRKTNRRVVDRPVFPEQGGQTGSNDLREDKRGPLEQ